jgi:hypothetical protein
VLDTATTGQVNLSVIPEPTSLLATGALTLAAATACTRRRRRRS